MTDVGKESDAMMTDLIRDHEMAYHPFVQCSEVGDRCAVVVAREQAVEIERLRGEVEALRAGEASARADERRKAAEEIARAIEVGNGERCPECGGKPASLRWKRGTYERVGRCGGGHTWTHRRGMWLTPATVAREHATARSGATCPGGC